MFWNAASTNNDGGNRSPPPGYSSTAYHGNPFIAPTIRGSIRPIGQQPPTRQEHFDSYLNDETLKRSTRRVSNDDSTYDTVFQSIYGDTLILRVHWPVLTQQTQLPPAMTLAGVNAKHPWLDSRMRVTGYEAIQSQKTWVSSRVLLGTAVHEVVKHLQVNPPDIIEITDTGLRSIQQPKTAQQIQLQGQHQPSPHHLPIRTGTTTNPQGGTGSHSPVRPQVNGHNPRPVDTATRVGGGGGSIMNGGTVSSAHVNEAPPNYDSLSGITVPDIDMPPIPNRFDELDSLSRDELEKLCNDDMEFTLFCNKLPIIQTYQKMLSSVIDDNAIQAKKNSAKEEELQDLYKECVELESKLKVSIDEFQKLEKQQDEYCQPPDMKLIMKELVKSKKDAFDESEQIARTWLDDGASNVDEFLTHFLEKRKLHHERAAKMELLTLQQQQPRNEF